MGFGSQPNKTIIPKLILALLNHGFCWLMVNKIKEGWQKHPWYNLADYKLNASKENSVKASRNKFIGKKM